MHPISNPCNTAMHFQGNVILVMHNFPFLIKGLHSISRNCLLHPLTKDISYHDNMGPTQHEPLRAPMCTKTYFFNTSPWATYSFQFKKSCVVTESKCCHVTLQREQQVDMVKITGWGLGEGTIIGCTLFSKTQQKDGKYISLQSPVYMSIKLYQAL